jgi:hypothetical protein
LNHRLRAGGGTTNVRSSILLIRCLYSQPGFPLKWRQRKYFLWNAGAISGEMVFSGFFSGDLPMAVQKTFTQEQIEAAREKLATMPDQSKNRISSDEMLDALKSEILTLATQKGYNVKEIKACMDAMGMGVSERAISGIVRGGKSTTPRRKVGTKNKDAISQ